MQDSLLRRIDFPLLLGALALIAVGLTFVFSATHSDGTDSMGALKKQAMWVVIGLVPMTVAALIDYRKLRPFGHLIYAVNIVALIAVMFLGDTRLGAQRWIELGPIVIQPSEFSKLMLVVALAALISEKSRVLSDGRELLLALGYIAIPWFLVFKQPDLGTSLVIAASSLGILLVGGMRAKHFLMLAGSTAVAAFLAIKLHILQAYQLQRLLCFLDPTADRTGACYNLYQSQIAVGSGGFSGKGLFEGTQSTLNFLPHHDTDFIFSVIGEEWGFLGGLLLIGLFTFVLVRILFTALSAKDLFGSLLCAGVAAMLLFQMTVNVGMTIGIMPITGIPLPFISSGGSSMITSMTGIGILLSVYARRMA